MDGKEAVRDGFRGREPGLWESPTGDGGRSGRVLLEPLGSFLSCLCVYNTGLGSISAELDESEIVFGRAVRVVTLFSAPGALARSHLRQTTDLDSCRRNHVPCRRGSPSPATVQSRRNRVDIPRGTMVRRGAARGLSTEAGKTGNSPAVAKAQKPRCHNGTHTRRSKAGSFINLPVSRAPKFCETRGGSTSCRYFSSPPRCGECGGLTSRVRARSTAQAVSYTGDVGERAARVVVGSAFGI